jgi:tetratricopeptide (TPR) repeat protein
VELRTGNELFGKASRGQTLTVQSVKDDWLWIHQDNQRGWIHRQKVIPADQALAYISQQLESKPDPEDYAIRGRLWFRRGKPHLALADLNEALRIDPTTAETWCNRGSSWSAVGEFDRAIADYNEAINLDPTAVCHFLNRGNSWYDKKEFDLAIADYAQAIHLDPNYAAAFLNRGSALEKKGELQRAVADYSSAIRLKPDFAFAYQGRADVRRKQGENARAVADYERSLELNSANLDAANSLAWLLATCSDVRIRDGKRAVEVATRICEYSNWKRWELLDTLAAACAEAGDHDDAARWQQMALEMAPQESHKEMKPRLALYRAKQAYRQLEADDTPVAEGVEIAPTAKGDMEVSIAASAPVDPPRKVQAPSTDSPHAALAAFNKAAQGQDLSAMIQVLSPESQSMWAGSMIFAASFGTSGDVEKEESLQELFDKFGVDLEAEPNLPVADDEPDNPAKAMKALTAPIEDMVAFTAELESWMSENLGRENEDWFPPMGKMVNLEINGTTAAAKIETTGGLMPVSFVLVKKRWLLNLPTYGPGGDEGADSIEATVTQSQEERLEEAKDAIEMPTNAEQADVVAELTPEGFPLPKDAKEIEREEDIQWIIFRSQLKPTQISKFYQDRFAKLGFKPDPAESFVDDELGIGSASLNRGEQYLHIVIQDGAPKSVSRVIIDGDAIAWPDEFAGLPVSSEEDEPAAVIHSDLELGNKINNADKITTAAKVSSDGEIYTLSHCIAYQLKGFDGPETIFLFTNRPLPIAKFRKEVIENGGNMFDVIDTFGLNYLRLVVSASTVSVSSQVGGGFTGFGTSAGTRDVRVRSGKARGRIQFTNDVFDPPFSVKVGFDIDLLKP